MAGRRDAGDAHSIAGAVAGGQGVKVIDGGGNIGFAGGCNAVTDARPSASAWWVLNSDAEPARGALKAMAARLTRDDVAAVGSALQLADALVQGCGGRSTAGAARTVSLGYGLPFHQLPDAATVERAQNYLLGASMLVGRKFREITGPMRDDYFLYFEQVEWCLRAGKRGLKLGFAPEARVLHRQRGVMGSGQGVRARPKLPIYLDERNRFSFIRDTQAWLMPVAVPMQVLQVLCKFARHGAWPQVGHALGGMLAGLRNERGRPAWVAGR